MTVSQDNIDWIEHYCHVPEGRLFGQPIRLHEVQKEILRGIYDSKTRRAIVSMGRKNTKTCTSAMLLLLHLVGPESKPNSQLYSSAQSRDQAAVLFNLAAKMVRMSPELSAFITIRDSVKQLYCPKRGTLYRALSAEASTAYGLSPAFVVHDELGQVRGPRSDMYEALETAAGAQEAPLSVIISTQAPNDSDLLSVLIDDAQKGEDPTTKLFLWTAPEDADPFVEATWKLANPLYGEILNPEVVAEQAEAARRMPSREAAFRNLVLNQRIDQVTPLISRVVWDSCSEDPDPEVLKRNPVFAGLDLSARTDLTAFVYMAQDDDRTWHVWAEFWAPKDGVQDRARRDRAPYDLWASQNLITLTPGASVDYEIPAKRLLEIKELYDLRMVSFDRWRIDVLQKEIARSMGIATDRIAEAFPMKSHGQGFRDMSPAIDSMEAALLNKQIRHGNNPILSWCAANAQATMDPAGNRKIDKKKASGRVDGIQALAMAFGAAAGAADRGKPLKSIYEQGVI